MADVNVDLYCERLEKSGLFTAERLSELRGQVPADADVEAFAGLLLSQNLLTKFQDSRVRAGHIQGLLLGEYEVLDELGRGSRAMVYRARKRGESKVVVMKLLPPVVTQDPIAVKRFAREVDAMSRVKHKNVVQALDHGEAKSACFLIMELVEGHDLSNPVANGEPMDLELAVQCILQAARGLAEAHRRGVIHRDIKPANLLLTHDGVCKVLDLGLARLQNTASGEEGLTQTGSVMGTVDYLPPEQAFDSKAVDHRADIYALGATLYHLVTGITMYPEGSLVEKIMNHRDGATPSMMIAQPEAPDFLDLIYQRMVAKSPDDRYATMDEVVTDLEICLGIDGEEEDDEAGNSRTVEEGTVSVPTELRVEPGTPDARTSDEKSSADAGVEATSSSKAEVTMKFGPGGFVDLNQPSPLLSGEQSAVSGNPAARPQRPAGSPSGTTHGSSSRVTMPLPQVPANPPAPPTRPAQGKGQPVTPPPPRANADVSAGVSPGGSDDDHVEEDLPRPSEWWLLVYALLIGSVAGAIWYFLKNN